MNERPYGSMGCQIMPETVIVSNWDYSS